MRPLHGVRVVELAGIGPVPYAGMLLADLGAEVTRIDRAVDGIAAERPFAEWHRVLDRGRARTVALDLKRPDDRNVALLLAADGDVLLEGFRPGVAERLGIGPDECHRRNPGLIYGRMTGWGQRGPLAGAPGHDINYLAISGLLAAIGGAEGPPVPPLNLLADFAGGGMLLVTGVLAALLARQRSGVGQGEGQGQGIGQGDGQVVEVSMVDGVASLSVMLHGMVAAGQWRHERGSNLLEGGAPFYAVYRCADERYVAVGALEEQFYQELLKLLDLDGVPDRANPANWPQLRRLFTARFATRTRDDWAAIGANACVTPVLTLPEAWDHPQLKDTYVTRDGMRQPAPVPRFRRTPLV